MVQPNVVEFKQATEKAGSRKIEPTEEKRCKNNDLVGVWGRECLTSGGAPVQDFFRWKNPLVAQLLDMTLGHVAGFPLMEGDFWGLWSRGGHDNEHSRKSGFLMDFYDRSC